MALATGPTWKTYLYFLQQKAPTPIPILSQKQVPNRPPQYGAEFHGLIGRQESESFLSEMEGSFLVRESRNPPGSYSLDMRINGSVKVFKLYYDGQHYVGDKRFDDLNDLVHDGLITLYMESKAAEYIAQMATENNYRESPYMALRLKNLKPTTPMTVTGAVVSPSSSSSTGTGTGQLQQQSRMSPLPESVQQKPMKHLARLSTPVLVGTSNGSHALAAAASLAGTLDSQKQARASTIFDQLDVMQHEKPHEFMVHTFKGPHWCDFCANFLWGLKSQGVKCKDCGFKAHRKCSERTLNDCVPQMKYIQRVFGAKLTTLVRAQNTVRPSVVDRCIAEIEGRKGGLDSEGIYRIPGYSEDVESIQKAFEQNPDQADISEAKYPDINVISGVLKLYLRVLPIPLVAFDFYEQFLETMLTTNESERIQIVQHLCSQLPPAHYHTLRYLMLHLNKVSRHADRNQMTAENLSIVFGPTLMRSSNPDPVEALRNSPREQKVIRMLIEHPERIFIRNSATSNIT